MKRITAFLMAVLLAVLSAGCKKTQVFTCELLDENGLKLTAENASKGSTTMSAVEVKEGQYVRVAADIKGGAITIRMVRPDAEEPSVEWEFLEPGETEYQLDPGTYNVTFETTVKDAFGTITLTIEGEAPNPVRDYVGTYVSDRCTIHIEELGSDGALVSVHWSISSSEGFEWMMSGPFEEDQLRIAYSDAVKKYVTYQEDGSINAENILYENGAGTFVFTKEKTLVWDDSEEQAANNMTFDFSEE
ncbi:MAG: hypothetical protein J6S26_04770 [Solobacterium sp.]|nr:hypothetical protein [Solobacterium sp.]